MSKTGNKSKKQTPRKRPPKRRIAQKTATEVVESISVTFATHKRTEEELRKREEQLRETQRLANLGSWEWDMVTDTVTWSDELYRICGVSRQEFDPAYDVAVQLVHPDDKELVAALVERAYKEHEPFNGEYRIIRPDGDMRTVQSRGTVVVDDSGRAIRIVGTGQDITERKRIEEALRASEERLRLLVDSAKITPSLRSTVKDG
jgi:PAS domain S-box-containing protein